jgi:hypothetical protein
MLVVPDALFDTLIKGLGSTVSYSDLVSSSPGLLPRLNLTTSFFFASHEVIFTESIFRDPST